METARYAFHVEWLNTLAEIRQHFTLLYYIKADGKHEVEMFDKKNRKTFLRRVHFPGVELRDLFVGAKVTIFGRQLDVVEYEDEFTSRALGSSKTRCLALITEAGLPQAGAAWTAINEAGLYVVQARMVAAPRPAQAMEWFSDPDAVAALAAGRCLALEVKGPSADRLWLEIAAALPGGDRKLFLSPPDGEQTDIAMSAVFGQQGKRGRAAAAAGSRGGGRGAHPGMSAGDTARCELGTSTCAVILPHAVKKGAAGGVLAKLIESGLEITALRTYSLDLVTASEFLEVYDVVVPEYKAMAEQMSAGLCVAIELSGRNAVSRGRRAAGPREVDVARRIRKDSIRGTFGDSTVANAVHVTDLEEDGPTECEYFFRLLDRAEEP